MKTTILKLRLKNTLDRINGQLDIAKEKFSEHEDVAIKLSKIKHTEDFPGSPMCKTHHFHSRRHRFNP